MVICKHCRRDHDEHGLNEECLIFNHGETVGFRDTFYYPKMPHGYDTKTHLKELVKHLWIYSGYPNHGYQKMSIEMKSLWKHVIDEGHDES